MLVLSRKPMERIHIGDRVVITVIEVRGNRVRIGIDAPKEVHVLRSELLDQVSNASSERFPRDSRSDRVERPRGIEALKTDGPSV